MRPTFEQFDWLCGEDTGISSRTIFEVMTGYPALKSWGPHPPLDPSDFGRCFRLLQRFPEWRRRLPEVAERHPEWAPLVREWDKLEALWNSESSRRTCPALYALMQRLRAEDRHD